MRLPCPLIFSFALFKKEAYFCPSFEEEHQNGRRTCALLNNPPCITDLFWQSNSVIRKNGLLMNTKQIKYKNHFREIRIPVLFALLSQDLVSHSNTLAYDQIMET
mgnify:CR=1 FL=1